MKSGFYLLFISLLLICSAALVIHANHHDTTEVKLNKDKNNDGKLRFIMNILFGTTDKHKETIEPAKELRVINAAYGRTGTKSLTIALENLGYRCFDADFVSKYDVMVLMNESLSSDDALKKLCYDVILKNGFDCIIDLPMSSLSDRFKMLFPSAKMTLAERDPETWYQSMKTVLNDFAIVEGLPFRPLIGEERLAAVTALFSNVGISARLVYSDMFPFPCPYCYGIVSGKTPTSDWKQAFVDRNNRIKQTYAKDLLTFKIDKDHATLYNQLIDHLQVKGKDEYRNKPFPRVNERQSMANIAFSLKVIVYFVYPAFLGLVFYVFYKYML